MLEYDKVDFFEGTHVNKTNGAGEHIVCHYWFFFEKHVRFQSKAWIEWLP